MVLKATLLKKSSKKKTFLKVNLKGRGKPFVELWKGISNQMIKYQLSHIGSSFKLGITNMTYNWMERYPLSYQHKQLIKVLHWCLRKLNTCLFFLKYAFRTVQKLVIQFWTITFRRNHQRFSIKNCS